MGNRRARVFDGRCTPAEKRQAARKGQSPQFQVQHADGRVVPVTQSKALLNFIHGGLWLGHNARNGRRS